MNAIAMTDAELVSAYESACNMAAGLYVQNVDTTTVDAQVDVFLEELIRRGLA